MPPTESPDATQCYRIEHESPELGRRPVTQAGTLAAALLAADTVRRWLRAGGADGVLLVVDRSESPARVISTFPLDRPAAHRAPGPR